MSILSQRRPSGAGRIVWSVLRTARAALVSIARTIPKCRHAVCIGDHTGRQCLVCGTDRPRKVKNPTPMLEALEAR